MHLTDLNGKVAVVTGAAASRALAAEGVRVVMASRSVDRLKALAQEIGESALVVPTEGGEAAMARLFSEVRGGRPARRPAQGTGPRGHLGVADQARRGLHQLGVQHSQRGDDGPPRQT